jgi:hypothetical protein
MASRSVLNIRQELVRRHYQRLCVVHVLNARALQIPQEVTVAVGQFIFIIVLALDTNFVVTGWAAWNGSLKDMVRVLLTLWQRYSASIAAEGSFYST